MSGTVSQLLDELGGNISVPLEVIPRPVQQLPTISNNVDGVFPRSAEYSDSATKRIPADDDLINRYTNEAHEVVTITKQTGQPLGATFDKFGTLLRVRDASSACQGGLHTKIGHRLLRVNGQQFSHTTSFDVIRASETVSLDFIFPFCTLPLTKTWEVFTAALNNLNINFNEVIDASPDDRSAIIKEVMPNSSIMRAQVNTKWVSLLRK
eukprot:TRINITY_DN432_c3_g1_i1.p1 TRINITY_DN432_c3_g1~~TRINITY_DN432_c3_g1_i1.p1  ORF type:complete len:209 (+),score=33.08 TRINITY_DN432_c3_g1_i1:562-1188(+)